MLQAPTFANQLSLVGNNNAVPVFREMHHYSCPPGTSGVPKPSPAIYQPPTVSFNHNPTSSLRATGRNATPQLPQHEHHRAPKNTHQGSSRSQSLGPQHHPQNHPYNLDRKNPQLVNAAKRDSPPLSNERHDTSVPSPDNHGYPPSQTHSQSQSRRGSGYSVNGSAAHAPRTMPLQCHSRDCGKLFVGDHDWRAHKTHCRCRGYQIERGFQCSFVGCQYGQAGSESESAIHKTLTDALIHEKEHHEVLFCVDCGRIFPNNQSETAAEHAKACSIQSNARQGVELEIGLGIKSNSGKETPRRGSAGRRGRRIKSLWAKDSQHVIQHSEGYERSDLFDLNYPERSAEVKGKESVRNVIPIKQRSPYDSPRSCNSVPEPFRTAMVKQLVEALKVHNNFLEAASDAVLELLPEEKDEVRECLQKMARMLRIEMGSEDAFSPSFGRKTHQEKRSSFSAPAIAVVPAASTPGANDALPVGGGTLLTPRVVDTQSSSELDPSSPAPNTLNIRPEYILSRSASPARQPLPPHEAFSDNNTAPDPAPSSSQAQQPTTTTIPSLKRTASNSVTLTTEEGEPLQETHISQEDQYAYFTQMMNCCQEAVYDWFIKNRDVLLENCECKMLVAASAENSAQVPGVQEGNAAPSCNGKTLTKQQKRRLKRMAAAAAAASSEAAGNDSGTQSSTAEGGPATPAAETAAPQQPRLPSVCLLHTVTGPTTLTLPRWTHHLRRLVEQNRIPPHIIANKDSFSGEIQPVDEVRHAVHKRKLMSDRDLLALVQQARKFCWQLKDWDRCRTLDELYEILENAIKLVKEEEGWTDVVGGSMRGRRRGRVVSGGGAERRVVVGSSRQGNTVGGEGEEGVWGVRRARGGGGAVKQSFTWPRMPDESLE